MPAIRTVVSRSSSVVRGTTAHISRNNARFLDKWEGQKLRAAQHFNQSSGRPYALGLRTTHDQRRTTLFCDTESAWSPIQSPSKFTSAPARASLSNGKTATFRGTHSRFCGIPVRAHYAMKNVPRAIANPGNRPNRRRMNFEFSKQAQNQFPPRASGSMRSSSNGTTAMISGFTRGNG